MKKRFTDKPTIGVLREAEAEVKVVEVCPFSGTLRL